MNQSISHASLHASNIILDMSTLKMLVANSLTGLESLPSREYSIVEHITLTVIDWLRIHRSEELTQIAMSLVNN